MNLYASAMRNMMDPFGGLEPAGDARASDAGMSITAGDDQVIIKGTAKSPKCVGCGDPVSKITARWGS